MHKKSDGTLLESFTYQLSPAGLRTRVTEADGSSVAYTYDKLNRLTGETRTGTSPYAYAYEYDAVGNRVKTTKDGVVTLLVYDDNDRLLSQGEVTYQYYENGNLKIRTEGSESSGYTYDYENYLEYLWQNGNPIMLLQYDADGNRIAKLTGTEIEHFIIDPLNNTGYAQVLEERDTAGTLQAYYVYGDDLLEMQRDGVSSFYQHDGGISVRLLTSPDETVTDTYLYDAFGNTVASTGSTENPYRYTGEYYDSTLAFYYLRARFYDPRMGRFATTDPFGGLFRDPVSLHKYLYASGDPINRIDPSGLWSLAEIQVSANIRGILSRLQCAYNYRAFYCRGRSTVFTIQETLFWGAVAAAVVAMPETATTFNVKVTRFKPPLAPKGTVKEVAIQYSTKGFFKKDHEFGIEIAKFNGPSFTAKINLSDPSKSTVEVGKMITIAKLEYCSIELATLEFGAKVDVAALLGTGSPNQGGNKPVGSQAASAPWSIGLQITILDSLQFAIPLLGNGSAFSGKYRGL